MNHFRDILDITFSGRLDEIKPWYQVRVLPAEIKGYSLIPSLKINKPFVLTSEFENRRNEIIDWLDRYSSDDWTIINYFDPTEGIMIIAFKSEDDAVRFKLRF